MKNNAPAAGPMRSGGRFRLGVSAAIISLAAGFVASPAKAIDNFPFIVETHLQAEQLAFSQRINGSVDAPRGPDFNRKITEARDDYWQAYGGGHIPEDIENKFATLLAEKDVSMMLMVLSDEATSDVIGQFQVGDPKTEELVHRLWTRMSESVDGGVRPGARDAFIEWKTVVKRRMDADPGLNPFTISVIAMKALGASLEARDPQVRAYVEARNRAEMKAVLDELPFDSDRDYLLTRLYLDANDPEHVAQWHEQLEQLVGTQVMGEIAGATRKLPKDGNGNIDGPDFVDVNGKELRLSAKGRIERLVGNSSPELYMLWQIRLSREVSWPEAQQIYQAYWIEPFGEQKVLEAAERVRNAEKTVSPLRREVLLDPIAGTSSPERALAKLMPYPPYRDLPSDSPDSIDSQQAGNGNVAYFDSLAEAAWQLTPEMIREYEHDFATEEYENLVHAFGKEKVATVIARVRAAVEENSDLATLEGTVSGSREPLVAIYEILWSSSPEAYLEYLRPGGSSEFYYRQYGRDALLAAVGKIAGAKKQLGSLESFDNVYFGNGNRVLLVDRQSVGLPSPKEPSDADELTVKACLSDLLHQPPEAVAAVPIEVRRPANAIRPGPQPATRPVQSARATSSFKPEDFPDGSQVRLKWRNEILEGTIREYHTRHGWKVDIQTPGQLNWTWVRPNQVELYELTLIDPLQPGASNVAAK